MTYAETRLSHGSPVPWPSHWRTVPLWSMFERVKDVDHPNEDLLSVYREHGVVKREGRDDNFNKAALNRSIYQLVHPGWYVVNRMKAWQGSVGISSFRGIVSGHYICFRPTHGEDDRFLNWLLRSAPYAAEYASLSRGVRPNQVEIDNEWLRSLRIMLPPLEEQRRIADFLDAETARIDALTNARDSQLRCLEQLWDARLASKADELIATYGLLPLRRVVSSVEQGWSPQCDDAEAGPAEWAVLKTSAVSSGLFKPLEHKRLPSGLAPDLRYQIMDGDILITRGSGSPAHVGVATVAAVDGRKLLLSDLLYRVRLDHGWSPEYVTLLLASRPVRGFMSLLFRGQSGQTIKLRSEDIRSIVIPAAPIAAQAALARELASARLSIREAQAAIRTSSALLAERRQALITAAVTGQFDVSTASGRNVTDGVSA